MFIDQSTVRNRLLRLLTPQDFSLLAPHLSPCRAEKGKRLFERDTKIDTVWFLDSGIGSIVSVSPEGQRVESGLFGRDGFAPVALAMGSDQSPCEGLIQLADDCHNIPATALQEAIARSPTLHNVLLRYAHTLSTQTAYTALSNAVHPIEERLARWILMCHDRMEGDELPLMHEFLAVMLAVRRPSVTIALHVLERHRLIRSERGCIIVCDRPGLIDFARDAYGLPEAEYERLLGPLR